ncbi:lipase/thioesterase [Aspergillus carlsbadensis]|nr:lipase/thioesterase [Aspergillus carlsbadensis]
MTRINTTSHLSLSWRLPLLLIRCVVKLLALCLSRSDISLLHWRQKLALAFLQALEASLTTTQRTAFTRKLPTGAGIQRYCRKNNLSHEAVAVDLSTHTNKIDVPAPVLHFVKDASAHPDGPTIFYFHGGGYHNPIRAEGHVPFALLCAKASRASRVVFLEYSLTPEQPYPCQLIQAVAGLRYLLEDEDERIDAGNIILAGDSAGGHLIASLLAHIVHPSPYAAPIDLRGGQFRAVVPISPWLVMARDERDRARLPHAPNDWISRGTVARFTRMFRPALDEVWSDPLEAEAAGEVWKRLFPRNGGRAVCRRAILAVGTSELLFGSFVKFATDYLGFESICIDGQASVELLKEKDFVLAIAPGETHVQPSVDCALKYHDGRMTKAILAFLEAV